VLTELDKVRLVQQFIHISWSFLEIFFGLGWRWKKWCFLRKKWSWIW